MTIYYNENNLAICSWLSALQTAKAIPRGFIDHRNIQDIDPDLIRQMKHCHFFAGIGGWAHASDIVGWPIDEHIWTASLPCQPFSVAGKRSGDTDDRHLWPVFRNLIKQCKPSICFGEQTSSPLGRDWLANIQADLETLNYRTCAANLCGACIGSPQQRSRLYWMAYSQSRRTREDWKKIQRSLRGCGNLNTPWKEFEIRADRYGKKRIVKPRIKLLVNGFPRYLAVIGGFGNAIIPQVGALFIKSCVDAIVDSHKT